MEWLQPLWEDDTQTKRGTRPFQHGCSGGKQAGNATPDKSQLFSWHRSAKLRSGAWLGKTPCDIIRDLMADGWMHVATTGSHHHFKHPAKSGKVTVPHPKRDLPPKTVRSIYRQAQIA